MIHSKGSESDSTKVDSASAERLQDSGPKYSHLYKYAWYLSKTVSNHPFFFMEVNSPNCAASPQMLNVMKIVSNMTDGHRRKGLLMTMTQHYELSQQAMYQPNVIMTCMGYIVVVSIIRNLYHKSKGHYVGDVVHIVKLMPIECSQSPKITIEKMFDTILRHNMVDKVSASSMEKINTQLITLLTSPTFLRGSTLRG